jgi:hypothetical protein
LDETVDTDPYLPFGIKILDARQLFKTCSTGETLYITLKHYGTHSRLWLASRIFNYEVDWTYHFEVSLDEAREIVSLGYARWHSMIRENER